MKRAQRPGPDVKPLRVHVFYEFTLAGEPHGCSHIRLLLPLSHPSLQGRLVVSFGSELPREPVDLVLIERIWQQSGTCVEVNALLDELAVRGIPYIHTFDDNLALLASESHQFKAIFFRLLRDAAGLVVSTHPLAEEFRCFQPLIKVVPNALDERLFGNGMLVYAPQPGNALVRFGYMGTFTHLPDLRLILEPLRAFLTENAQRVEFELVGISDPELLAELFPGLPVRIKEIPPQSIPYPEFVAWLRAALTWDFAVAPLANTVFNSYKSDLKYLDYALLGLPAVYSDHPVYNRTVRQEETGLLAADSPEAWGTALRRMLDPALRKTLAENAAAHVRATRLLATNAVLWADAIQEIFSAHRARTQGPATHP